MMVEEDKKKFIRRFKDIFDINIPLAKLININIEKKSSSFHEPLNSNLSIDLISTRTPYKSFQINTSIESNENEQDSTKPLSLDIGDINATTPVQYTEQPLKLYTNDIGLLFNIRSELPNFNNINKLKHEITTLDMNLNDEILQNIILQTSTVYSTTSKDDEINFEVTYSTSKPGPFSKSTVDFQEQDIKFDAININQKSSTTVLKQLDINTRILPNNESIMTTFAPSIKCANITNEDSSINIENSENLHVNESNLQLSSSTMVENYTVSSNSNFTLSDVMHTSDFLTEIILETEGTTVGNKFTVEDSLAHDIYLTTPYVAVDENTNNIKKPTLQDVRKIDVITSEIGNNVSVDKNSTFLSTLPPFFDLKSNNTNLVESKLNETNLQKFSVISSTVKTISGDHNNDSYIGNSISSTIVISLASSFIFSLIIFVIVSLCIIRKHKFQSKVYLSYELGKPRSYSTKPMKPSILAEEASSPDKNSYVHDHLERPKQPLYIDQELGVCFDSPSNLQNKISGSVEIYNSGIDNAGFVDCSSDNIVEKSAFNCVKLDDPCTKKLGVLPKYTPKKKKAIMDSRFKVCSSDGNIYYTSPSLTKCLVPPPPYSPRLLYRSSCSSGSLAEYSSIHPSEISHDKESAHSRMEVSDSVSPHSTSAGKGSS